MDKLKKLKGILKIMNSVLVAYSGGADSTFLLKVAHDVLGDNVLAVTANSATYPGCELAFSKRQAKALGIRHKVIKTHELKDKRFSDNPVNRCYFCKKELFTKLKEIARKHRLKFVIDASNASDSKDFRPGNIAKNELNVCSPLLDADFTKEDIRKFSRSLGLITWDKPSLACLASRIPYGAKISAPLLKRINQAELYLRKIGAREVRVRHYNNTCRIEVGKDEIDYLINKRKTIIDKLKKLGYNYVTVDLEGYRTGSMNPAPSQYSKFLNIKGMAMNKKKVRGERGDQTMNPVRNIALTNCQNKISNG
jgi:pyridinium-3,5-biscarboxylic acid mononucleotide sulfurtransferase